MKRILFLTLLFLPFIVVGQVVRNRPANVTTPDQVSAIVSDSISALKPCAIFYSNNGSTDLSTDSTDAYVQRCGEVSLFLNLTGGFEGSNLIANFNNPDDSDLGKTVTITALDENTSWNIQVAGLFYQGEDIIFNYTLRNGETIILTATQTDAGNRWVFTKWGTGVQVFTGSVGDTATYTNADQGSILLIGTSPFDSIFVMGGDDVWSGVWNSATTAIADTTSFNIFEYYPIVLGTGRSKSERISNFTSLKQALLALQNKGEPLYLPSGTIEIHAQTASDFFEISKSISIIGQNTTLDVYPKLNNSNTKVLFYHRNGNLTIDGVNIIGNTGLKLETYPVIIKADATANKIRIPDTTAVRVGFWSELSVGEKIGIGYGASADYTISSIDSTTKSIFLTTNLPVGQSFDRLDSLTKVGVRIKADGDIVTKVQDWVTSFNVNTFGISNINNLGNYDASGSAKLFLINGSISGFDSSIGYSSKNIEVDIKNYRLNGRVIGISIYNLPGNRMQKMFWDNVLQDSCGIIVQYNTISNGDVIYGGATYIHPHVQAIVQNSQIINNFCAAFRQYGTSPAVAQYDRQQTSIFKNNIFYNNNEYSLRVSTSGKTIIEGCKFLKKGVYAEQIGLTLQNQVYIRDSEIETRFSTVRDIAAPDSVYSNIVFDNCIISGGNVAAHEFPVYDTSSVLRFVNCTFLGPNSLYYGWGTSKKTYFQNCNVEKEGANGSYSVTISPAYSPTNIITYVSDCDFSKGGPNILGYGYSNITYINNSELKSIYFSSNGELNAVGSRIYGLSQPTSVKYIHDVFIDQFEETVARRLTANIGNLSSTANSMYIDPWSKKVIATDTLYNAIFSGFWWPGSTTQLSGYLNFNDPVEIYLPNGARFNSVKVNSGSNIKLANDSTIYYPPKTKLKATLDRYDVLNSSDTSITVVVGVGNGSSKQFTYSATAGNPAIIYQPGITTVTTNSGLILRLGSKRTLSGTGGKAYLGNDGVYVTALFDVAPASGDTIKFNYTYKNGGSTTMKGVWRLENMNEDYASFVHDQNADTTYIKGQLRHVNTGEANPDSVRVTSAAGVVSNISWTQAADSTFSKASFGEMYIDDIDTDTIAFTGGSTTPAKSTDWLAGELQNFTYSNGRLTYTGTQSITVKIDASISFSFAESNTLIEGWIYKTGSEVAKSEFHRHIGTGGDVGNSGISCLLTLATNDYIELFFAPDAHSGNDNLIIQNANVNVTRIK